MFKINVIFNKFIVYKYRILKQNIDKQHQNKVVFNKNIFFIKQNIIQFFIKNKSSENFNNLIG